MSSISIPNSPAGSHVERVAGRSTELALASVPWYIWCAVAAVTSAQIGGHWDISWHRSIGRDTFWTPAHVAIYACGVLAGISFGYLILRTTFDRNAPLRNSSVSIVGLRGPIGAFIGSWGGITMLTSAPFDNWWHNAYGLDVTIVSPPHLVLFCGVYGVLIGTAILIAGHMNRVEGTAREVARWVYLYASGILMIGFMVLLFEYINRARLHSSLPYILMSLLIPIVMASVSRVTGFRFAATLTTAFYTLFLIGLILILPLFPAEPKLGPVYQHVTKFVPPGFPILLIVPALLLDLFWSVNRLRSTWLTSLLSACLFVLSLIAVEWPFASFLMTPASRNAFFATAYFSYDAPPSAFVVRNQFAFPDPPIQLAFGLLIAIAAATMTFRFGIKRGNWIATVKR